MLPFFEIEARMQENALSLENAMNENYVQRICCRRMIICHPRELEIFMENQKCQDIVDDTLNFALYQVVDQERVQGTA